MRARSLGRPQEPTLSLPRRTAAVLAALSLVVLPAPPAAASVPFEPAAIPDQVAARVIPARADRWFERSAVPVQPVTEVVAVAVKPKKPAVKPAVKSAPKQTVEAMPVAASGSAAEVVRYVLSKVGSRYVWGAEGPSSFDCSGLSRAAYLRIGISLAHQSGAQARAGRAVSRSQLRPGDLVIYSGHIGVAISASMMVHAANPSKGVVKSAIYGSPIGYRRIVG